MSKQQQQIATTDNNDRYPNNRSETVKATDEYQYQNQYRQQQQHIKTTDNDSYHNNSGETAIR